MRVAYLILAHKNGAQLLRLLRRLGPDTAVVIHIDRKSPPDLLAQVQAGVGGRPSIRIIRTHTIFWGHYSQVAAVLEALKALFALTTNFDYVKFISGQDYPLTSQAAFQHHLEAHAGCSFVENFRLPNHDWDADGGLGRFQYLHYWLNGQMRFTWPPRYLMQTARFGSLLARLPLLRPFPAHLIPYGGSAFWCLTREAAAYVLEFVAQTLEFVRFFQHVYCGDELFFQTILLNSPWRDRIVNDDLTYACWLPDSASPEILGMADMDALAASGSFFARKFDSEVDTAVLDWIDQRSGG